MKAIRTTNKIIVSTALGALVAAILVIYRIYVFMNYCDMSDWLMMANHLSVIVTYGTMGLWLLSMADYRYDPAKDITTEFKSMKKLSFIASAMSLARFIVAAVYFWKEVQGNTLTDLYVACELTFWLVLTMFFLVFGIDRAKKEKLYSSKAR